METQQLLARLIDYAGVFPPAHHPVTEARRRYAEARSGPQSWMLGPFLVSAGHLAELDQGPRPAPLGIVVDGGEVDPRYHPVQVETRVTPGRVATDLAPWQTSGAAIYAESRDPANLTYLEELAAMRAGGTDARAKIRTGGATADTFPTPKRLAAFVIRCHQAGVPFKATAGLHQPYRHPSTVPGAMEHGFINLLAAVRAVVAGDTEAVQRALAATDPGEFDAATATWRGVGRSVAAGEIRAVFRSFGSCSFSEPVRALRDLGVLPTALTA